MLNSTVGAFYFIVLQILWLFRLLYYSIVPDNNSMIEEDGKKSTKQQSLPTYEPIKRHLIHLITTPNHRNNGRPICHMQVFELLTAEEEILRCVCAKGCTPASDCKEHQTIMRKHKRNKPFTWFDT